MNSKLLVEALQNKRGAEQKAIAVVGLRWLIKLLSKNADYGSAVFESPCMAPNMPAVEAIKVRLSDKIQRIQNLATKEANVVSESVSDTYDDLGAYCLLMRIVEESSKDGGLQYDVAEYQDLLTYRSEQKTQRFKEAYSNQPATQTLAPGGERVKLSKSAFFGLRDAVDNMHRQAAESKELDVHKFIIDVLQNVANGMLLQAEFIDNEVLQDTVKQHGEMWKDKVDLIADDVGGIQAVRRINSDNSCHAGNPLGWPDTIGCAPEAISVVDNVLHGREVNVVTLDTGRPGKPTGSCEGVAAGIDYTNNEPASLDTGTIKVAGFKIGGIEIHDYRIIANGTGTPQCAVVDKNGGVVGVATLHGDGRASIVFNKQIDIMNTVLKPVQVSLTPDNNDALVAVETETYLGGTGNVPMTLREIVQDTSKHRHTIVVAIKASLQHVFHIEKLLNEFIDINMRWVAPVDANGFGRLEISQMPLQLMKNWGDGIKDNPTYERNNRLVNLSQLIEGVATGKIQSPLLVEMTREAKDRLLLNPLNFKGVKMKDIGYTGCGVTYIMAAYAWNPERRALLPFAG